MSWKVKCYSAHGTLGTFVSKQQAKDCRGEHLGEHSECIVILSGTQSSIQAIAAAPWHLQLKENDTFLGSFFTREKARKAKKEIAELNPLQQIKVLKR